MGPDRTRGRRPEHGWRSELHGDVHRSQAETFDDSDKIHCASFEGFPGEFPLDWSGNER